MSSVCAASELVEARVRPGDRLLVLWSDGLDPTVLERLVTCARAATGAERSVHVDNIGRFSAANYTASSFHLVLSCRDAGAAAESSHTLYTDRVLSDVLTVLHPGGTFCMTHGAADTAARQLTLAGFVDCTVKTATTTAAAAAADGCTVVAYKPNYEVGSSVALKLPAAKPAPKPAGAGVWTLDSTVDDDLVGDDELLSSEDMLKPDPQSLRVCGTTGRRKACKDCSCGLAEELATEAGGSSGAAAGAAAAGGAETGGKDSNVKSSCGSCYLGDAFRCASCPYLGMPAFKPGQQVQLSSSQLAADS